MRRNIIIIVVLALVAFALVMVWDQRQMPPTPLPLLDQPAPSSPDAGALMPDFSFTLPNGKIISSQVFSGKVLIINFWASWCPPCVKEFPDLLQAAHKHRDDVVLIALSSDLDESTMQNFLNRMSKDSITGDNIFIALDSDQAITQKLFQTYRLPETWIIDRQGRLADKLIGATWKPSELDSILDRAKRATP